jgi:hypothetical protein
MNSNHINSSLDKIRSIFEKASSRIDALQPGERLPATKMAEELGAEVGIDGPQLYTVIKFLLDGYPGVDVKRGAKGGIIKHQVPTPVTDVVPSSETSE